MNKLFFGLLFLFDNLSDSYCFNLCGTWTEFSKNKCITIAGITSELDGMVKCGGKLLTIYNQDEQDYLNMILADYNESVEKVWLGLTKENATSSDYLWSDGSRLGGFKNWEYDPPGPDSEECVTMSLGISNRGKWSDEKCDRNALVVCEREKKMDLTILTNALNKVEEDNAFLLNSLVPIGFIYTQMPKQSSPQVLWPTMNWNDVTKEYSGLFFRAEGKDSNKFGEIQEADQSRISNIKVRTQGLSFLSSDMEAVDHELKQGERVDFSITGNVLNQLVFDVTKAENRPKNTAVKIWKRIEWPS